MRARLDDWHGYSAYEIAVQNGFVGTQEQWLASLGTAPTVNRRSAVQGNITLTAEHIARSASNSQTVEAALTSLESGVSGLNDALVAISNADIDTILNA